MQNHNFSCGLGRCYAHSCEAQLRATRADEEKQAIELTRASFVFSSQTLAVPSKQRLHDEENTFSIKTPVKINQKQMLFPSLTLVMKLTTKRRPPNTSLLPNGVH